MTLGYGGVSPPGGRFVCDEAAVGFMVGRFGFASQ